MASGEALDDCGNGSEGRNWFVCESRNPVTQPSNTRLKPNHVVSLAPRMAQGVRPHTRRPDCKNYIHVYIPIIIFEEKRMPGRLDAGRVGSSKSNSRSATWPATALLIL